MKFNKILYNVGVLSRIVKELSFLKTKNQKANVKHVILSIVINVNKKFIRENVTHK